MGACNCFFPKIENDNQLENSTIRTDKRLNQSSRFNDLTSSDIANPEESYKNHFSKFSTPILEKSLISYSNFDKYNYKFYEITSDKFFYINDSPKVFYIDDINKNSFYYGQVNDSGIKHGEGLYMDKTGFLMEGFFKNNYLEPFGRIITSEGFLFEGSFELGQLSGKGKSIVQETVYIGNFKNGIKDGNGEEVFGNETYKGEFSENRRNGYGELLFANYGAFYKGNFVDGKMEGIGNYTLKNGENYIGGFKNNLFDGQGEYRFNDGKIYRGYYEKGVKKGFGELIFNNGLLFKGEFDDFPIKGILISSNGEEKEVKFSEGKFLDFSRNY